MTVRHPQTSRAPQSCQQVFYPAAAAAIENKQSLTPTLHRDCGVNNSSFQFYDEFQWTQCPVLQSQDLMCDSLVFTHNTPQPVSARPCLTLVVKSCQSVPVVQESRPGSPENTSAFQQRKEPSAWQTSLLTAGDPFRVIQKTCKTLILSCFMMHVTGILSAH